MYGLISSERCLEDLSLNLECGIIKTILINKVEMGRSHSKAVDNRWACIVRLQQTEQGKGKRETKHRRLVDKLRI